VCGENRKGKMYQKLCEPLVHGKPKQSYLCVVWRHKFVGFEVVTAVAGESAGN
jgi:hypothetical protein